VNYCKTGAACSNASFSNGAFCYDNYHNTTYTTFSAGSHFHAIKREMAGSPFKALFNTRILRMKRVFYLFLFANLCKP
jgi:hypothetical protein